MTPERKAWWDCLPTEEKRVRQQIKNIKERISLNKQDMPLAYGHLKELTKLMIHDRKCIIKALRKQIAMKPWERKGVHPIHCPCCWTRIYANGYKPPYCDRCGQKLRWD